MSDNRLTRRAFLGGIAGFCLVGPTVLEGFARETAAPKSFLPIRPRLPNPWVENGRPVVAVVQGTEFEPMLARGLEMLGGFARFGTGHNVIVKPNFVFNKRTRYPTTTDEDAVLTTVQFLHREGFADITVADRRGDRTENGRAGGKFEWSGLNDKAEAGGFVTDSLMDNSEAPAVTVRDDRWTEMPSIGVIQKIYDAGLIINMPTLKRHTQTDFTCSLKNMMGVLDVPTTMHMHLWRDEDKAQHESMPKEDVHKRLGLTIAEAAMAVSPEVTVIDAREVLCTNHTSYAQGTPRTANRLIISGDQLAADVVAAGILKDVYEPFALGPTAGTFDYAARLGIGARNRGEYVLKESEV